MNNGYETLVNNAKKRKRKRRQEQAAKEARKTAAGRAKSKQHSVGAIHCTYCDKPGHHAFQCEEHAADCDDAARSNDVERMMYCLGTGMTQQQPADSDDDEA